MSDLDGMVTVPARPEEQAEAFRLLFQHLPIEVQVRRVARARKMLFTGELDANGIFVLRRDGAIIGAALGLVTAGGVGMIWPPHAAGEARDAIEDVLALHAIGWLQQRGMRIGQCLLHPDEAFLARPLERHGFQRITGLWYLRLRLDRPTRKESSPSRLDCETVATVEAGVFHETLRRTYEGTLDFPEITGVITIDQAVAGHRGLGPFRPELWWLACHAGRPVGVLLMNELPGEGAWEIAYVGVVAGERGHGFARELLNRAIAEAQRAGVTELILSVDQRNEPAWQLYRSMGFEPFDSREVYLVLW